jgi:hypothetical protein
VPPKAREPVTHADSRRVCPWLTNGPATLGVLALQMALVGTAAAASGEGQPARWGGSSETATEHDGFGGTGGCSTPVRSLTGAGDFGYLTAEVRAPPWAQMLVVVVVKRGG